ncbi:MAG TPA: fibronectin type III domain-containing protein, partial [Verrucomicrobiae bacterium]|nr:fibronectin type III domain-containing protein [Verrucomicrobiae bacterium]
MHYARLLMYKVRFPQRGLTPQNAFAAAAFLACLFFSARVHAAGAVTLAWDASTSTNVAGYRIYCGPSSGNYTNFTSPGKVTSTTISNLVDGGTYYFAATAYDTYGQESDFSTELQVTLPGSRPVETPPVISAIDNQIITENHSSGPIAFTIGDFETAASSLTVSGASSDTSLIPNANIAFGGSASNRTVTLTPAANKTGTTVITVTVNDGITNTPSVFTVLVQGPTNAIVTITKSGDGEVTPKLNSDAMKTGKKYTFNAVPAKGEVFAGWSGSVVSSSARITFTLQSNMTFNAAFVPSPFPAVSGKYGGLFYEDDQVRQETSGSFSVLANPRGHFSAKLRTGGRNYGFSGQLGLDLATTNVIRQGKATLMTVQFRLGTNSEGDRLFGQVSGDGWTAAIQGDRAVFGNRTNPAPKAGVYTLVLPGVPASPTLPAGYSYGSVHVKTNGLITFSGSLADGGKL